MPQKSSLKLFIRNSIPKTKVYLSILIVTVTVFLILISFNSYFELKTIHIEGDNLNIQIFGLENLKGKNLYLLSEELVTGILNENNPKLIVDELVKEYPDSLTIKLKSVQPIAQIKLNIGFAELSAEGKILKKLKQKDDNLPLINFYQQFDYYQISQGSKLDYKELKTTLFLLKKIQDLALKVDSIDISGLNMIVFNLKNPSGNREVKKIFLSAEKERRKQSLELETILSQFKIEGKDFKELDLRFDKPVVRF